MTVALHNTVGLWFVLFVIEQGNCSLCMHKVPEFKSSATYYDRDLLYRASSLSKRCIYMFFMCESVLYYLKLLNFSA